MGYLTNLDRVTRAAAQAAGVKYDLVQGWRTRGHGPMAGVRGVTAHHTAGPRSGNYPSLNTVLHGRPGLRGPLAHFGIARDGTILLFAAGLCYHAGKADQTAYTNPYAIGIEWEHSGNPSEPITPASKRAYVALCGELAKTYGVVTRGHKETAVPRGRKVDPVFSMPLFRKEIDAYVARGGSVGGGAIRSNKTSVAAGFDVRQVQQYALSLGIDLGPAGVDGIDGPATRAAVASAQSFLGVEVDGVWGSQTHNAYIEYLRTQEETMLVRDTTNDRGDIWAVGDFKRHVLPHEYNARTGTLKHVVIDDPDGSILGSIPNVSDVAMLIDHIVKRVDQNNRVLGQVDKKMQAGG